MTTTIPVNNFGSGSDGISNDIPSSSEANNTYFTASDFEQPNLGILEPSNPDRVRSVAENVALGTAATAMGMFDTVGRSVGLLSPDTIDKLASKISPNFGEYYQNNKQATSFIGDMALALPIGFGAGAAVRGGSWLYKALNVAENSMLAKAFTNEAKVANIVGNIYKQDLNLVNQTRAIDVVTGNVERAAAVTQAQKINQINNLKQYLAGETAIYMTMSDSENIYPSDMGLTGQLLLHSAGIGVTGALEYAFMRNQIRSSLRRPEFREAVAGTIDGTGLMDDVRAIKNDRDLATTIYALNSAEQRATRATASGEFADKLKENSFAYEQAFDGQVKKQIEGMIRDGIPEVLPRNTNPNITQTILRAGKDDPTIYPGMQTATNMPTTWKEVEEIYALKDKKVEKLTNMQLKNDTPAENIKLENQLRELNATEFFVLEANGSYTPVAKRKPQWHDNPTEIKFERADSSFENGKYTVSIKDPESKISSKLAFDNFGIAYLPEGKTFTDLSSFEMSAMQGLVQRSAEKFDFTKHTAAMKNIILASDNTVVNSNDYFRLEFANAVINKDPKAVAAFKFPEAVAGNEKEWLETQLLSRKYDIYKTYRQKIEDYNKGGFKSATWIQPQFEDLKVLTNLPNGKLGNEHPALQVFEAFYKQGEKSFETAVSNLGDFYSMMKTSAMDANHIFDRNTIAVDPSMMKWFEGKLTTDGGLFARPKIGEQFYPAALVAIKPIKYDLTKDTLVQVTTARKMQFISEFLNPETTPLLVKELSDKLLESSAFKAAGSVKSIAEGQQTGSGILTSQQRSTAGIDTFTAVDMIANAGEKHAFKIAKQLFDNHQDTWINLRKAENADSMYNFAEFAWARRFGFEIDTTVPGGPARHMYMLKTEDAAGASLTKRNIDAYRRMFGEDVDPADAELFFLPKYQPTEKLNRANYQPMRVTNLTNAAINAIDSVSQELLQSTNFFRRLYGQGEIAPQAFYIPPQNFTNQYIKYIVYPQEGGGQPFKQMVTGRTPAELNTKLEKVIASLKDGKKQFDIIDQQQMKQFFGLHDEAFFNMVDYSDSLAQTAVTKGSSASPLLLYGQQVLTDAIAAVENQALSLSRRTISALFENELQYARMADGLTRTDDKVRGANARTSIWKQYTGRLLSDSRILADPNVNILGGDIGTLFDKGLNKLNEAVKSFLPETAGKYMYSKEDLVGQMNTKAGKDFNTLREQLGGYLPFTDTEEFVKNTFKVTAPVTARDIAGTLNTITANLAIRILDAGNAYVSLLGNFVSMPLVMNMMRKQSWDTPESFAARSGIFGINIDKDYSIPSTARMAAKTMAFAMTKEGKEVIREGYEVYNNLQKRMSDAFDAIHDPLSNQTKVGLNKTINWLSTPSDKGEEVTRGWAYLTGYLVAKEGYKVANAIDRHMVANLFANNMIADYRHVNKPQVFQGALGSVLGMFQTYMWNYYGRMFGYIENKNYRALAINYAMQGSVFGAQSVPGFEQFNNLFMHAYNGQHDVTDALDQKFGPAMTSVIMHGSFANIPRIFAKDGMNIYSRGDTNLTKIPAFISPENAPIFNLAGNVTGFFGELLNQIKTGGQVNPQQTLEALGTYAINRPFGRVMELIAGTSVDKRGAVISNDVRTTMSVVSRIMGLRPTSESASMEALYRVSTSEAYQRALNERIQNSVRSIFRGNPSAETIDNTLGQALSDYIKGGGNPKTATSFIKDAVISAYISKDQNKLMSIMNSPGRTNDVLRIINAISQYEE